MGKILSEAKSIVSSPLWGVGKRSYVTVNFNPVDKKENFGIEFFVENVVSTTPGDPDFGFTTEDLTLFRGVAIYSIDEDGGERRTKGEVIPFCLFLDRYISNDAFRTPIEVCMDRLEEEANVEQKFLDRLNMIWQDRDVDRHELYDKKVH